MWDGRGLSCGFYDYPDFRSGVLVVPQGSLGLREGGWVRFGDGGWAILAATSSADSVAISRSPHVMSAGFLGVGKKEVSSFGWETELSRLPFL